MGDFHIHKPSPRDGAKTPEDAIRKIRYSPVENLYVFKNGIQIRRFVGEIDRVTVENVFLSEMKDSVIIHNHPQGSAFSKEDIQAVYSYDVKELILVTHEYVYRIIRPRNGWGIDFSSEITLQQYEECCALAEDEATKSVARNEIGLYEKDSAIIHYIWSLFFQLNDIVYVRKRTI